MKETKLTEKHIALGAKMAPFAGYNMPISYTTITEEHLCVRNGAGVFDVSHMGEFIIKGEGALDLVQRISSNDASKLIIGQAQYSCLPNKSGGIVDDMIVYKRGEDHFLLVVNASNIEKDWNWIVENNTQQVYMEDISDKVGLLAVQGPKATEILQKLTDVDLSEIAFYHFSEGKIAGIDGAIISATGYTGSGGFEVYVDEDKLVDLWDAIFEAGKSENIMPIGLGARDTLRLEMGYCLYGNDINDETSPIEAGLSWITKLNKETAFNSQDIFKKQKAEGVKKALVAFTLKDRRVPRHGYAILNKEGEEIGEVTSGTQSPSLDIPIGMGYVHVDYRKAGTEVLIKVGKKELSAELIKLPFYKV
jgi:aminomethyltransferase